MPEDLKVSQIRSSQLPPPFRGLHSPGVRKHCQIIFACYFRKSSIDCIPQSKLYLLTSFSLYSGWVVEGGGDIQLTKPQVVKRCASVRWRSLTGFKTKIFQFQPTELRYWTVVCLAMVPSTLGVPQANFSFQQVSHRIQDGGEKYSVHKTTGC